MFFRPPEVNWVLPPDKYVTAPLNKIFIDKEEKGYFKKISESTILLATKLETENPEVRHVTCTQINYFTVQKRFILLPKNDPDRLKFLSELTKAVCAAALENTAPRLPAQAGKPTGEFFRPLI